MLGPRKPHPQTANKDPALSREEKIIINRVIRDDPSKGDMHNRQPITPNLLWKSLKDYDLWPLYILGLVFQLPSSPPTQYLTLTLRGLGFDTFRTNLLTIPSVFFHMVTMMALTYVAEIWKELTFTSLLAQIWLFPFLVFLYVRDIAKLDKWVAWGFLTFLLSYPSCESRRLLYCLLPYIAAVGPPNVC